MKKFDEGRRTTSIHNAPFDRALADFSRAVDRIFRAAAEYDRSRLGEAAGERLFEELEVAPDRRLRAAEHYLLRSYDIFRVGEACERATDRRRALEAKLDEASRVFETMRAAEFGAFRVTFEDATTPAALRLDGQPDQSSLSLAYFGDSAFEEKLTAGTYVGWRVEVGGQRALVLAANATANYHRRLTRAAEREPWGVGDDFRKRDYAHDVLALLVDRQCVDTGRSEGRIFLSSALENDPYLDRDGLRERVARRLIRRGLPGAFEPQEAVCGGTRMHGTMRDQKVTRRKRERGGRIRGGVANWSLEAAMVAGASFTAARDVLALYRRECLRSPVRRRTHLGDESAEYLLPLDELVSLLGLQPDGGLDHPKVERAERYRLACLDLSDEYFAQAGFDAAWTIAQALGWASQHADPLLRKELDEAVHRHRAAIRWAAIVDKNQKDDRAQLLPISYKDVMEGFQRLAPTALETPIERLDDPGRGTWSRIEAGAREALDIDDGPVRLRHLPADIGGVRSLPGVGRVSVDHLEDALLDFAAGWPESAGHRAVERVDETTDDDFEEGLAELEGMF
ncbi:MAG: hypothetical protein ACOCV2_04155 [Persicimonas sp.]